jgi:hypothetical protein
MGSVAGGGSVFASMAAWGLAAWLWQLLVADVLHVTMHVADELGTRGGNVLRQRHLRRQRAARRGARDGGGSVVRHGVAWELLLRPACTALRWLGFIHTCHHRYVDAFANIDARYTWRNIVLDKVRQPLPPPPSNWSL